MSDIVINQLEKRYGEHVVLKGLSARFPEGKITCVTGESGCGKTTLLHILAGLCKADGGSIQGLSEKKSVLFQEDRLLECFSAVVNLRLSVGNKISAEEIISHLEEVGIGAEALEKPVGQFSGGMKRRVALVRAVLYDGEVLLLDEPFTGLDGETRKQAVSYLLKYKKNRTVIFVSHEEGDLVLADRWLRIESE